VELLAWVFDYNCLMLPEYVEVLIHSSGHEDIFGRMVHGDKEVLRKMILAQQKFV
jgi:hypothetical protein